MNNASTQSGRDTLKNLRVAKVAAKPLHVAMFSAVQNMISFAVRTQSCDKTAVTSATSKQAVAGVQRINERGQWSRA